MSGQGQAPTNPIDCNDLRVAVVAASWHSEVMDGLIGGAVQALADYRVDSTPVVRVPGSFELPVVAQRLAQQGFEAIVALGVVIRGGTPHFEYVCQAVTEGLGRISLDHGVAVGFGLLTCDDDTQALERAGLSGSKEDKGYEAAAAALETASLLRQLPDARVPSVP